MLGKDHSSPSKRAAIHRGPGRYWSVTFQSSSIAGPSHEQAFRRALRTAAILDGALVVVCAVFFLRWAQSGGWTSPYSAFTVLVMLVCVAFTHVRWWRRRRAELSAPTREEQTTAIARSTTDRMRSLRTALAWALAAESGFMLLCLYGLGSAIWSGTATVLSLFSLAATVVVISIWAGCARAWWRVSRYRNLVDN